MDSIEDVYLDAFLSRIKSAVPWKHYSSADPTKAVADTDCDQLPLTSSFQDEFLWLERASSQE
jgi:hypothetical protein